MTRGARAARGTAIAVFATFVASLAHTLGGGTPPAPLALLVALAFSAPLAMLLADARARRVRTAVSALIAQAALHLCYAWTRLGATPPRPPATAAGSGAHAGHIHDGITLAALPSSAPVDHGHVWMPVAHLVAAAATMAALLLADRVLDAIAAVVVGFVRRLTTIAATLAVPSLRVPAGAPRARLVGALLHAALGSRGPPVVPVAA
jgi:hypothetical protein